MSTLFENAVEAIQLGVEDYEANDPRRASSAARNFFSGVLLLAKEALLRAAPQASPEEVLGVRYKPVPDGEGGVALAPASNNTVDFSSIGERLRDFGVSIDLGALKHLGRIRNDIEHSANPHSPTLVREAIANAFPVVSELFQTIGEEPASALGDAWASMLSVKALYDRELQNCLDTYGSVAWQDDFLPTIARVCPNCASRLVAQLDSDNTDHQSMESLCRACGQEITAEFLVEHALESHLDSDIYISATDGGESPLGDCPECGLSTYVSVEEHIGCVWCGTALGDCAVCGVGLTPDNVSPDSSLLCSYHAYTAMND